MSIETALATVGAGSPETAAVDPAARALEPIADIPVTICAELDRRNIALKDLLELECGDLLPLSRPTGENIGLYLGSLLLATAEIQVNDAHLAVRIAEISAGSEAA